MRAEKETEIIKVSLMKLPPELDGIMFVADNKKIRVGIEGRKDVLVEMDLGGKYILDHDELVLLVRNSKKLKLVSEAKSLDEIKEILIAK